jgi:hypothetical protein
VELSRIQCDSRRHIVVSEASLSWMVVRHEVHLAEPPDDLVFARVGVPEVSIDRVQWGHVGGDKHDSLKGALGVV